jgi:UDP-N-acetylmuramoylalanine--D-glutamate ligase
MGEQLPVDRRVLWFSMGEEVTEGAYLRDGALVVRMAGRETIVCRSDEVRLLGAHNLANCLAACALGAATGASTEALRQAVTTFEGVEHRLELIRDRGGVRWYNDSKATTPDGTIAALQSFDSPVVLLAGGRDKHLPWDEMAAQTWEKARHLILFGEAAALIERAMLRSVHSGSGSCQIHRAGELEQAVELAAEVGQPGDVVLLSPGGTSYDAYGDYAERGEHFRQLVKGLE